MHRPLLVAVCLLGLTGCDSIDPLYRAGTWKPMHVNRTDLTLQAAYPGDLVRGAGVTTSDGVLAAAAVDRLHANKVKKLPDTGTSQIAATGQGGGGE